MIPKFKDLKKTCPHHISNKDQTFGLEIVCYHLKNPSVDCSEGICPILDELQRIYEKKNSTTNQ